MTTRKQHYCFTCSRLFPRKSRMWVQINNIDGKINNIYTCLTCEELLPYLTSMKNSVSDYLGKDFVKQYLNKNQTPEDLLDELKT